MCARGEGDVAIGTMDCVEPRTGRKRMLVGLSGAPERVEPMLRALASRFPADCVLAPAQVDPAYWAGRDDPRFQPGKNPDGSPYSGDSRLCAIPRMYQCLGQKGWKVNGMSLAWQGEGPNPFPRAEDNPDLIFMDPCPSCTANVEALMQGAAAGAQNPSPETGAPSLWSRIVKFFQG